MRCCRCCTSRDRSAGRGCAGGTAGVGTGVWGGGGVLGVGSVEGREEVEGALGRGGQEGGNRKGWRMGRRGCAEGGWTG